MFKKIIWLLAASVFVILAGFFVAQAAPNFVVSTSFPGNGIWDSSGNVGIGITNPGQKFQLHTTATADPTQSFVRLEASNFGIDIGGGLIQNVGAYGTISTVASGIPTEKIRINNLGNVGIGTTAPGYKLEVAGAIGMIGGGGNGQFNPLADGGLGIIGGYNNVGTLRLQTIVGGEVTDRVTIKNDGNVGIGTTNPLAKVDITGTSTPQDSILIKNQKLFNLNLPIGANYPQRFEIWLGRYEYVGNNARSAVTFSLNHGQNNGNADTDVMTLLSNGNVGIGTTAPNDTFSIGNSGAAPVGSSATGHNYTSTYLSTDNYALTNYGIVKTLIAGGSGSSVGYWTMNGTDINNSNAGNVGIGTTTPGATLDVNGNMYFGGETRTQMYGFPSALGYTQTANGYVDGTGWHVNNTSYPAVIMDFHTHDDPISSVGYWYIPSGVGIRPIYRQFAYDVTNAKLGINLDNGVAGGINTPKSNLSVGGNASIGQSYVGSAAPSDGLIVQGNVGIGTTNPGALLEVAAPTRTKDAISFSIYSTGGTPGKKLVAKWTGGSTRTYKFWVDDSNTNNTIWWVDYRDGTYTQAGWTSQTGGYLWGLGPSEATALAVANDSGILYFNRDNATLTATTCANCTPILKYSYNNVYPLVAGSFIRGINTKVDDAGLGAMVSDSSGNVGIGTTGPGNILEIAKNDSGSHDNRPIVIIHNTATGGGYNKRSELQFTGVDSNDVSRTANILSMAGDLWLGTANNGNVTINSGTGFTTMTGKVGIGTTNPLDLLSIGVQPTTGSNLGTGHNSTMTYVGTDTYALANIGYVQASLVSSNLWSGTKNGPIWNGDAGVGNVGIGTTAPTHTLQVSGSTSLGDGPFIVAGGGSSTTYFDQNSGAYQHTPGAMIRNDNAYTDPAQMDGTLVLYNKNGTDLTGSKLVFAANETTTSSANPVATAAIVGIKTTGAAGSWANGRLDFLVKNGATYVNSMSINNSGYVGIGTTGPTDKLHLLSTVNTGGVTLETATDNFYLTLKNTGTNGTSWNLASVSGTSGWGGTTGNFVIVENGANPRFVIQKGGNVGIGTTNPTVKLQVVNSSAGGDIINQSTVAGGASWDWFSHATGNDYPGGMGFWSSGTGYAMVLKSNKDVVFNSGGNVGIGATNPTNGKLEIQAGSGNTAYFQSSNDSQLTLKGTDTWAGLTFSDTNGSDYIWYNGGNSTFSIGGGGANIAGKKLNIYGGTSIGTGYSALGVPSNGLAVEGNVGIGTTAPNDTFSIGNSGAAPAGSSATGHNYTSTYLSTDNYALVNYGLLKTALPGGSGSLWSGTKNGNIWNGDAGAGNVGIGTTAPKGRLNTLALIPAASMTLGAATQPGLSVTASDGGQYGMYFGVNDNGNSWIQAGRTDSVTAYNMSLQASGGNVGIGTTAPGSYKLNVNGNIYSDSVTIGASTNAVITSYDATRLLINGVYIGGGNVEASSHLMYNYQKFYTIGGGWQNWGTVNGTTNKIDLAAIGTINSGAITSTGSGNNVNGIINIQSSDAGSDGSLIKLSSYSYINQDSSGNSYWSWGHRYDGTNNVWVRTYVGAALPQVKLGYGSGQGFEVLSDISTNSDPPVFTSRFMVKNDGNVGIGTTAPNDTFSIGNSGSAPAGSAATGHNYTSTYLSTDNYALVNYGLLKTALPGGSGSLWSGTKNGNIWNGDAGAGNVGIGTSAPGLNGYAAGFTTLTVAGAAGDYFGQIEIQGHRGIGGNQVGLLRFYQDTTQVARIEVANGVSNLDESQMTFWTKKTGTALAQQMVIDKSGNVGIGTTAPHQKLVVGDDLGSITSAPAVVISDSRVGYGGALILGHQVSGGEFSYISYDSVNGGVSFRPSAGAEALFIKQNGYVGIGMTNPATLLQITNNNWISASNSAGTGVVNMFKVNASDQIEVGAPLNIGSFEFSPDSGLVSFVDMPVSATPAIGTPEGYVFKVDGDNIMTLYSEANGSGGVQNKRVGISTIAPNDNFSIGNDAGAAAPAGSSKTGHNYTSTYLSTDNYALVNYGLLKSVISDPTTGYLPLAGGTMNSGAAIHMSGVLDGVTTLGVSKINATTIDPLYSLNGVNYATFVSSISGGVKEEYVGKVTINSRVANNEYEKVIDFSNEPEGSDLWVWRQVVDYNYENIEVLFSPYGQFANVYYLIKDNKLIFRSDKPVTLAYRLVGRRFDWRQWPTKPLDQTEQGIKVK